MECPVCMELFDAAARRPKCLPCGHTVCSHCLGGLRTRCCPQCRRDITDPVTSLPDNFAVLGLVDAKQRPGSPRPSTSAAQALKMWCEDCGKTTADLEACAERGHALCSLGKLRKMRLEQAAPLTLQLEDMVKAELKIMGRLEGAMKTVEDLQHQCRTRLRQVRESQKKLRAAMDDVNGDLESRSLEVSLPQGFEKLQDAVSLLEGLEGKCGLWHRDGSQWKGDVPGNRSLLDALVLQLHHNGSITKDPAQQKPSQQQGSSYGGWKIVQARSPPLDVNRMAKSIIPSTEIANSSPTLAFQLSNRWRD